MRRAATILALILLVPLSAHAQLIPSFGSERSGTSGFQFLKIPVDARSSSLGGAVVSSGNDAASAFMNPALGAWSRDLQVGLHHTAYFVDVAVDYASVLWPVPRTSLVLGLAVQAVDSGPMDVTTEFQPLGTGQTFRLRDTAVGVTVAQRLTDLFSYGITAKVVRESVAGLTASAIALDLGMYYAVGTTGLSMAVAIRNFGLDGTPSGSLVRPVIGNPATVTETEFDALTLPTTFHMGVSYDVLPAGGDQHVRITVQLNNPNDNVESWSAGAEYDWRDTLYLRTGYRLGIEEFGTPSFGVGVRVPIAGAGARVDYGFNQLERLGVVHRIGLNLSL